MFAQNLLRNIFVGIKDDFFASPLQSSANQQQLWIVKMIDVDVERQRVPQHTRSDLKDAIQASPGFANIMDLHCRLNAVTQTISHHKMYIVAQPGQALALLEKYPHVIARMDGGQMCDSHAHAKKIWCHRTKLIQRHACQENADRPETMSSNACRTEA